ncbi:MAG: hypothetical protein KGJ41_00980 [Rhodospirillales bacterium]|nr:hypothetical protein [Rhodospirillales bacterium]
MRWLRRTGLAVAALGALGAGGARAQMTSQAVTAPVVQGKDIPVERHIAPAGLPGARSTGGAARAQPGRLPSDLSPNDALFDAIDRGDIAAARDAVGRGADLRARNVLGQTPIDLSVDLSRNDITFLLLSLRGASPGAIRSAAQPAGARVAGKTAPAVRPAAERRTVTVTPAGQPARAAAPRQFVDNLPGTPAPQAGFLGFGPPRQ